MVTWLQAEEEAGWRLETAEQVRRVYVITDVRTLPRFCREMKIVKSVRVIAARGCPVSDARSTVRGLSSKALVCGIVFCSNRRVKVLTR